jgi:hypothetical protein
MGRSWLWRVAGITACLVSSARSGAKDGLESSLQGLELDYQVRARACPSRDEFLRHVEQALHRQSLGVSAVTQRFRVELVDLGRRVRGTVGVDRGGLWRERRVVGQSCDEVVAALALAIVLALEPDRAATPPAAPLRSKDPKPAAAPLPSARLVPDSPANTTGGRSVEPTWRLGARGALRTGPAPGLSLELGAHVEARLSTSPVWLGASVSRLASSEQQTSEFDGWLTSTRLSLEPWTRWGFTLGLCAVAELGVVQASGRDVANPERQVRPWAAIGAGPRVQWHPLSPIFFELGWFGLLPLFQQRYLAATARQTLVEVYETPVFGYSTGFGVGAFL